MATKTVNIALDESLLREVDKTIKEDLASRSEYFRRLALNDLNRRAALKSVLDAGNLKGKKLGYTSEADVLKQIKK